MLMVENLCLSREQEQITSRKWHIFWSINMEGVWRVTWKINPWRFYMDWTQISYIIYPTQKILLHSIHYGRNFYDKYIEAKDRTLYIGDNESVVRPKQFNRKYLYSKYMNVYGNTNYYTKYNIFKRIRWHWRKYPGGKWKAVIFDEYIKTEDRTVYIGDNGIVVGQKQLNRK